VFASLSGGEQQRGLIARALVQRAELIVLDEPVNHLDVYYQHDVLALLGQLARDNGLTVVMSLHDLNLSAHYCDQLLLLDHG
ncbi:ATP-binding cassette domain-containing protein, partial [Gilvimarinus sp. 1_MG-2023]